MQVWQFKVRDLEENRNTPSSFQATARELGMDVEEIPEDMEVHVDVVLFRTDKDVFADAKIQTQAQIECRRCLTPVALPIKANFTVQYKATLDPEQLDDPFQETGMRYYMGEHLDIADEVREAVLLEIPHWVLCTEDCKGLCSVCGQDLNETRCDCASKAEPTGKLAVLKELLG